MVRVTYNLGLQSSYRSNCNHKNLRDNANNFKKRQDVIEWMQENVQR